MVQECSSCDANRDKRRADKRHHERVQDAVRLDESAIEKGQTGRHEADERRGDENPRRVATGRRHGEGGRSQWPGGVAIDAGRLRFSQCFGSMLLETKDPTIELNDRELNSSSLRARSTVG